MTPLRKRMTAQLQLRNLSKTTEETYLKAVAGLLLGTLVLKDLLTPSQTNAVICTTAAARGSSPGCREYPRQVTISRLLRWLQGKTAHQLVAHAAVCPSAADKPVVALRHTLLLIPPPSDGHDYESEWINDVWHLRSSLFPHHRRVIRNAPTDLSLQSDRVFWTQQERLFDNTQQRGEIMKLFRRGREYFEARRAEVMFLHSAGRLPHGLFLRLLKVSVPRGLIGDV